MPKFVVTAPDGKQYEITAPEGATAEQALEFAKAQISAAPAAPTDQQKFLSNWLGRSLKGMKDPIDAGAQLLPRGLSSVASGFGLFPNRVSEFLDSEARSVDTDIQKSEREYQEARRVTAPGRKPPEGIDWMRLSGNVVSPVNLGPAAALSLAKPSLTIGGLAKTGAAGGAISGLMSPVVEPTESFAGTKAIQSVAGGVGGAVLAPVAGKLVASAGRILDRKLGDPTAMGARASLETDRAIAEAASDLNIRVEDLPQDMMAQIRQQVLDAFKTGKRLDAAAQIRRADFDALGMKGMDTGPTLGQLTRQPMQFATEKNLRAVPDAGAALTTRFNNQSRALGERFAALGANNAAEPYQAGQMAIGALERADKSLQGAVSGAYRSARESTGKDAAVPLSGLAQDYAETLRNFGDKVPSGVRNRFNELGLLSGKQLKTFNVEDADGLLKVINANTSNDPATNLALSNLRNAVKNAVLSQGDDAFAPARKLAAERFSVMDVAPALRAASEGAVSPDDFVRKFVVNGKIDDLKAASRFLDSESSQQMRAQISDHLRRSAFGENVAGDKAFSPERYAKALRSIGTDKLKIFFNDAEVETFKRIGRVGAYIESAPAAAPVMGNPNMFWAGPAMGLLNRTPVVGALAQTARGAARMGRQQMDITNALNARIQPMPYTSPEMETLLPYLAPSLGVGGGLLGAGLLR